MNHRIGIVGTGHVGSEVANEIVRMNLGDCVLIDIRENVAKAKALDLSQSAPVRHSSSSVSDGGDFAALRGCGVVVLAAGMPRHPGMTRDDLLDTNCTILKQIMPRVMNYCPDAVFVVITNPLDAMTYAAWKLSGKGPRTFLGMAGALDSSRFCFFLASELGISTEDVHGMVLGSHGDLMVPLSRYASVAGIPAADLLQPQVMSRILERTKQAGTELLSLLESGTAYYAAGAAAATTVDSVLNDKAKLLCSSALCQGEYGLNGVYVGVPAVVGAGGVKRIVELKLNEQEARALQASAAHLRQMQERVDALLVAAPSPLRTPDTKA
jgi:malate dehydrogenase